MAFAESQRYGQRQACHGIGGWEIHYTKALYTTSSQMHTSLASMLLLNEITSYQHVVADCINPSKPDSRFSMVPETLRALT
jgi:hypothetical protein